MKCIMKLFIAAVVSLTMITMIPVSAKGGRLSVAKTVYYNWYEDYSDDDTGSSASYYYAWSMSNMKIKNIAKSAKVFAVKTVGAPSYIKAVTTKPDVLTKYPGINIESTLIMDNQKPKKTSFKLTFKVKQYGKTTSLSTTVKIRPFPLALKSLTINGKSYLKEYKPGRTFIKVKLAGTHPSIKYSVKKPYEKEGIEMYYSHKKYSKTKKLKKGDIISLLYTSKDYFKDDQYLIIVE